MRGPLRAIVDRLRRREEAERPEGGRGLDSMALGADEFQARLDDARERLRRDIPPPDDGDE